MSDDAGWPDVMDEEVAEYPEHEKLKAIEAESQAQGEFIEWLWRKGIHLVTFEERGRLANIIDTPLVELLADYHDIDLKAIEQEKRAMLDRMRAANV